MTDRFKITMINNMNEWNGRLTTYSLKKYSVFSCFLSIAGLVVEGRAYIKIIT